MASVGLLLGFIGAYFVGRGMQSTLFGVQALDFSAFGSVALILLGVCAAGLLPSCTESGVG